MASALGLYVSVPFCRAKCTYCNFASGVFSEERMTRYVERVCEDLRGARGMAAAMGASLPERVDTVYLGGGTPSLLPMELLERVFACIREEFVVEANAEITMECAPGQMPDALIDGFCVLGVNRVSLGVQSFVDAEARAVGRLHTRAVVMEDLARLRAAGLGNTSVDLIAGLPKQTEASWQESLDVLTGCGVPHASVYLLEVDEDSRLGREVMAGGVRYHAHAVPEEDAAADFYTAACERLPGAGLEQYEISNFARPGFASRHNDRYWQRAPYLGVGLDAHSMLEACAGAVHAERVAEVAAVRLAAPDAMEDFLSGTAQPEVTRVTRAQALEEEWFLGLRRVRGVDLTELAGRYGAAEMAGFVPVIAQAVEEGLVERAGERVWLTARGRLLSNEVFARFLGEPEYA